MRHRGLLCLIALLAVLVTPAAAAAVGRAVGPQLVVRLQAPRQALEGDEASVVGQIRGTAGGRVTLQRLVRPGHWIRESETRSGRDGRFRVTFVLKTAGHQTYRAVSHGVT